MQGNESKLEEGPRDGDAEDRIGLGAGRVFGRSSERVSVGDVAW
jgi:hypothetical protein